MKASLRTSESKQCLVHPGKSERAGVPSAKENCYQAQQLSDRGGQFPFLKALGSPEREHACSRHGSGTGSKKKKKKGKVTHFNKSWGNTGGENLFCQPPNPLYKGSTEKKKSLIIEKTLNQNVMYITGNPLRVFEDRKKVFSR